MDELKQLYLLKLAKALDMEETIVENMPAMIEASTNEALRVGLAQHLEETREQVTRVQDVLKAHKSSGTSGKDEPFRMMVENAGKEIEKVEDINVRDALIIAAAQSIEHHEIARYGTLVEWAKTLDEDADCIHLLKKTLDEEEASDKKLSTVAEGGIFSEGVNEMAAK